jgi:tetratricopeptide (TPR) repeat protein
MNGRYRRNAGRLMAAALAAALLMGAAVTAAGQQGRLDPARAESLAAQAGDVLQAADVYDRAWLNEKAIGLLEGVEEKDAAVLWRLARSRVNEAETFEDEDKAEPYFTTALEEARRAAEMAPESEDAHLMVGIAAGRVALLRGPFSAAGLVKEAFAEAHRAAALGDSIPVALYVIGRTHKKLMEKSGIVRKLAGLGFADEDSISYYFDRALEVSGGNMIQCHVEYADHLLEQDQDGEAREHLQSALELPVRDQQDPKAVERAQKMLEKL